MDPATTADLRRAYFDRASSPRLPVTDCSPSVFSMHRFCGAWIMRLLIISLHCVSWVLAWNSPIGNFVYENGLPSLLITSNTVTDRRMVMSRAAAAVMPMLLTPQMAEIPSDDVSRLQPILKLNVIEDNDSYSALTYSPPLQPSDPDAPLIVVLHGAGKNDLDIMQDLADPNGEHSGLIPSLIQSGKAPAELLTNFAVLAPYSYGKASFYEDPRSKLLKCIEFASTQMRFDPNRVFLFGFSDGATVAIELMTTRRFAGAVICSYGYSGRALPARALQRLTGLPMWVFHSADDVIFDIRKTSDRLVEQLRAVSSSSSADQIRYNRYDRDPEQLPPRVRGHSMGITASKLPEVYTWMLNQPPRISSPS